MSTLSSNEQRMRDLVVQQSADWFVANRAGLPDPEREAFMNWLKASPLHVEEYLAVAGVDRDLRAASARRDSIETIVARARAAEESSAPSRGLRFPRFLPTVVAAAAGLAVVCLAVLFAWNSRTTSHSAPVVAAALHFSTGHGEQATYRLADASVMHLNTDSAVTIRYSDAERRVVLESGEADFEVVHQQGRAFRVIAGAAETVDLGTRFDVRLADGATLVTVQEGRVGVALAATAAEPGARFVTLGTDQQIKVTAGELPATPAMADSQRTTSWLHRQIVFEREPLARVAAEFNRYSKKPIEIATPALKDLEISGVFATDDSEAFVAFLRSLDNVRIEETAKVIRVSQK